MTKTFTIKEGQKPTEEQLAEVREAAKREIPFEITSPMPEITRKRAIQVFHSLREEARENGLQGMSLDEINEEIRLARY